MLGDEKLIDAVSGHIERYIGSPDEVLHEVIPMAGIHVDIHVVRPTIERPYYTLVTSGMAEKPLTLPEGVSEQEVTPYVELMMCLPSNWHLDRRGSDDWGWPIDWMYLLARFPHEYNQFLYVGHTIPNGDPPERFSKSTDLSCWFIRLPRTIPEEACQLEVEPGRTVLLLGLTAIHDTEMEFALSDEDRRAELDEELAVMGITELLDLERQPAR